MRKRRFGNENMMLFMILLIFFLLMMLIALNLINQVEWGMIGG